MSKNLLAALSLLTLVSSAGAEQQYGEAQRRNWREACLHGGWNHPACDRSERYSSMEYYYHHDPRHAHGMAFGP